LEPFASSLDDRLFVRSVTSWDFCYLGVGCSLMVEASTVFHLIRMLYVVYS
jgi:hypothetical protein